MASTADAGVAPSEQDDFGVGVAFAAAPEQLHAIHLLHAQVAEHHVEGLLFQQGQGIAAALRGDDGVASPFHRLFNFSGYGDNPVFPGMYGVATMIVGATMKPADLVAEGKVNVAFNHSGGGHHAAPNCASGFCIFNDVVIAIKHLLAKGLRVAYVDIDAHHGDGVQNAFYDTDRVLTISLHETGRLLFPGTGEPSEIGVGAGKGYSVNIPLAAYTDDEVYLWAFDQVVPPDW